MSCLSFLGLAMKAGRLEYGEDTCTTLARAGKAKLVLTASDAGRSTAARAKSATEGKKCPSVQLPFTKDELGAALGRGSVSMAAVTDIGFASAFMDKLSAEYPGYGEVAAGLRLLDAKAQERRRELRRHEQKLKRASGVKKK